MNSTDTYIINYRNEFKRNGGTEEQYDAVINSKIKQAIQRGIDPRNVDALFNSLDLTPAAAVRDARQVATFVDKFERQDKPVTREDILSYINEATRTNPFPLGETAGAFMMGVGETFAGTVAGVSRFIPGIPETAREAINLGSELLGVAAQESEVGQAHPIARFAGEMAGDLPAFAASAFIPELGAAKAIPWLTDVFRTRTALNPIASRYLADIIVQGAAGAATAPVYDVIKDEPWTPEQSAMWGVLGAGGTAVLGARPALRANRAWNESTEVLGAAEAAYAGMTGKGTQLGLEAEQRRLINEGLEKMKMDALAAEMPPEIPRAGRPVDTGLPPEIPRANPADEIFPPQPGQPRNRTDLGDAGKTNQELFQDILTERQRQAMQPEGYNPPLMQEQPPFGPQPQQRAFYGQEGGGVSLNPPVEPWVPPAMKQLPPAPAPTKIIPTAGDFPQLAEMYPEFFGGAPGQGAGWKTPTAAENAVFNKINQLNDGARWAEANGLPEKAAELRRQAMILRKQVAEAPAAIHPEVGDVLDSAAAEFKALQAKHTEKLGKFITDMKTWRGMLEGKLPEGFTKENLPPEHIIMGKIQRLTAEGDALLNKHASDMNKLQMSVKTHAQAQREKIASMKAKNTSEATGATTEGITAQENALLDEMEKYAQKLTDEQRKRIAGIVGDKKAFNIVSKGSFLKRISIGLYNHWKRDLGMSGKAFQFIEDHLRPAFMETHGNRIRLADGTRITEDWLAVEEAFSRHAETLLERDIKLSADTPERIAKTKSIKQELISSGRKDAVDRIESAATKIHEAATSSVDYMVEKGLITAEKAAEWNEAAPWYLPFFRDMDNPKAIGDSLKKLKGSSRTIKNPIENIAQNIYYMTQAADKQIFVRRAVDELKQPTRGELAAKVKAGTMKQEAADEIMSDPLYGMIEQHFPTRVEKDEIEAVKKLLGDRYNFGNPEGNTRLTRIIADIVGHVRPDMPEGKNILSFLRDGKTEYWKITPTGRDDGMAEMLQTLINEGYSPGPIMKVLRGMKNIKRAGVTLSPAFNLRNPLRDFPMMNLALSKDPREVGWATFLKDQALLFPVRIPKLLLWDYPTTVFKLVLHNSSFSSRTDEFMEELLRHGAGEAGIRATPTRIAGVGSGMMTSKYSKLPTIAIDFARHPIEGAQKFLSVLEDAPRYIVAKRMFDDLTKKGMAEEVAYQQAALWFREATTDFGEVGAFTGIRKISPTGSLEYNLIKAVPGSSPFFTASIGGVRTFGRYLKTKPWATVGTMLQMVTAPSLLIWSRIHDDPEYKALTPTEKNMYWYVPNPISGEIAFRIPKPFEMGMLGGSLIERMLDGVVDKDPHAIEGIMGSLAQFMPGDPMPPLLAAIAGLRTNEHPFFHTPIEPEYMRISKDPKDIRKQGESRTGELLAGRSVYDPLTGKMVSPLNVAYNLFKYIPFSSWILGERDISPPMFDYLVDSFLGGTGKSAVGMLDDIIGTTEGSEKVYPAKAWHENQRINPFHFTPPSTTTYNEEVTDYFKTLKREAYNQEGAKYQVLEGYKSEISDLLREHTTIRDPNNTSMTSEQKRAAMDEIARQITAITREANAAGRAAEGQ